MQDDALYNLLQTDPDAGMDRLVSQYGGLVYAVVRGKLSPGVFCDADIEHCVADVFSEFYCDLDKYDPRQGSIKSWLCVIARHNALDRLRKSARQPDVVPLDDGEQYADSFSLEGDFERRDLRRALMQAIKALGPPNHEILVRKFFLGQSSQEIAARLNMTVSNVDTRTHRAIQKLRAQFGGELP